MAVPPGTIVKHKDGYYADPVGGSAGGVFGAGDIYAGYNQQAAASRAAGTQGYQMLDANYGQVTSDAAATRDRNMARINQYGDSQRSDLAIQNKQALAKASQSAIMRGLGNTTIQDSMVRGQNFDNTRQNLALEDQLLKNRISTDMDLSKTYQNTLQSRAQGLADQWNQNIQNDNRMVGSTLQYQGNIQQQNDQNQQRALDRQFQAEQAALNRPPQYHNVVRSWWPGKMS